jgi:SnoaL-like protein
MTTDQAVMTPQVIANRLHELCSQGKYDEAQQELYSEDAISVEPPHAQGLQSVKGLDAIIQKGAQFRDMIEEVHGVSASTPIVAGNNIAMAVIIDATFKGMGKQHMEEIAVYDVKDGKIVKEQFFYDPAPSA